MKTASPLRPYALRALAHTAAAVVVNLLVLGVGTLVGASFSVPGFTADAPAAQIGVVPVIGATVLPLLIGFAIAAIPVARRSVRLVRAVQVVGAVLGVLTVISPLLVDTDAATKVCLSLMHLVPVAAWVLALQPYAVRSAAPSPVAAGA